jgi:hypothetical protein
MLRTVAAYYWHSPRWRAGLRAAATASTAASNSLSAGTRPARAGTPDQARELPDLTAARPGGRATRAPTCILSLLRASLRRPLHRWSAVPASGTRRGHLLTPRGRLKPTTADEVCRARLIEPTRRACRRTAPARWRPARPGLGGRREGG